jgi:hypothetical protein
VSYEIRSSSKARRGKRTDDVLGRPHLVSLGALDDTGDQALRQRTVHEEGLTSALSLFDALIDTQGR